MSCTIAVTKSQEGLYVIELGIRPYPMNDAYVVPGIVTLLLNCLLFCILLENIKLSREEKLLLERRKKRE